MRRAESCQPGSCYSPFRTALVAGLVSIFRAYLEEACHADRQQLADLINGHIAAVVPGLGLSVAAVLSQLERQPGEYIVDRWVIERMTLVAEKNERVVAAAHLLRYAGDERVSPPYRNSGEIRWLLFWPEGPRIISP